MTSVSASGPPRNGTWTASKPALMRSRSTLRWVAEPTPTDAKLKDPGFALAAATKSWIVLIPLDGETINTFATLAERDDRRKVVCRVIGQVRVDRRARLYGRSRLASSV